MLRDYFATDYVLHLPRVDLDFEALCGYFASLRAAFTNLRLARPTARGRPDHVHRLVRGLQLLRHALVRGGAFVLALGLYNLGLV
jgi:hypothetical protein